MKRNRAPILFATLLIVLVIAMLPWIFFPRASYEFALKLDLRIHGVHELRSAGMGGLVRDHCGGVPADQCTCVALIHGLGADVTGWKKLLQAPASSWIRPVKLVALSMRHNERFVIGDNPEAYRVRIQAEAAANALRPLCPSWVVVGNSLGGWEAAWIVIEHQLSVSKLMFVDGAGTRSSAISRTIEIFSNPDVKNTHAFFSRIFYKPPVLPEFMWARISNVLLSENLGKIIRAQKPEDFLDGKLSKIHIPTMIVWGTADRLIPDSVGKQVHAAIAGSTWREIPDCGHLPQRECPEQLIAAINHLIR